MKLECLGNVIVNSTTTSGSKIVTPTAMTGIVAGMGVSGTGIPVGSIVMNVYATTILINNAATASGAVSLSYNMPTRYFDGFTIGWDKADYGNPIMTTYTPPAPDNGLFELRYVESTNGTAPGKRLYVCFMGTWNYVALS